MPVQLTDTLQQTLAQGGPQAQFANSSPDDRQKILQMIEQKKAQIQQMLAQSQGPQAAPQQAPQQQQGPQFGPAPTEGVGNQPGLPQQPNLAQVQKDAQALGANPSADQKNQFNRERGLYTDFKDPAPKRQAGDLTSLYNSFEQKQLAEARKRDANAPFQISGHKALAALDRTKNEREVRDRIDPIIQARITKQQEKAKQRDIVSKAASESDDARVKALDAKHRADFIRTDAITNTALINIARADAESSGQDFDEKIATKIITDKRIANDNDMSKVPELIADAMLDKKLAKVTKQLKLDTLVTKGESNKALRAKAMADTKKQMNEASGSGRIPLDKAVARDLQKTLVTNNESAVVGQKLIDSFKPEYFKTLSQGGAAFLAVQQESGYKLTGTQKRSLVAFTKFKVQMKKFFNKYKVSISGGAVSAEEMVDLEKAVANGTMSPTEAAATLEGMMEELRDDRAEKMRVLGNKGFDRNAPTAKAVLGPDSFQDALGQGGPSNGEDAKAKIRARLQELEAKR